MPDPRERRTEHGANPPCPDDTDTEPTRSGRAGRLWG